MPTSVVVRQVIQQPASAWLPLAYLNMVYLWVTKCFMTTLYTTDLDEHQSMVALDLGNTQLCVWEFQGSWSWSKLNSLCSLSLTLILDNCYHENGYQLAQLPVDVKVLNYNMTWIFMVIPVGRCSKTYTIITEQE